MARYAFLFALAAASASWAESTAVIWGGGSTAEAAEASLSDFQARSEKWEFIALAPGYPQVVKSDSVEGLKPGFFVVLLGVCANPGDAVDVLDALEPAVYTRPVKWSKPDACPAERQRIEREDTDFKLSPVVRVSTGPVELSAFAVSTHDVQGSESEERRWWVYAFARKGSASHAVTLTNSNTDFSTIEALSVQGDEVSFVEHFAAPSCVYGPDFIEYKRVWRMTLKGGRILAPVPKPIEVKRGHCG